MNGRAESANSTNLGLGQAPLPLDQDAPLVVAVVVNWNLASQTRDCIRSLLASEYPGLRVLLVDNGSTDGSVEGLRESFPTFDILALPQNRGFAAGTNAGIQWAATAGAGAVLLVNNDAIVAPDMVSKLVAATNPVVGVVMPRIDVWSTDRLWHAGARRQGINPLPRPLLDRDLALGEPVAIDYAVGCVLLIRQIVIDRVGMLDERYFMYYEDLDFSERVRAAGFQIAVVPHARAWHRVGSSLRHDGPRRAYLITRYRTVWCRSQSPRPSAAAWWLSLAYRTGGYLAHALRTRDGDLARAVLTGLKDGLAPN
jgi:GT2 family glycosyltransferase